jgi:isopentenyldiphosphate isomerase
MEELLDIVDENNNLTGKNAPRSQVHAEGLWHRTVHIYLFRKKNDKIEFLVHLRSPFKDLHPNQWDTRFGGHIKSGLSLKEGVKTELEEEIGLDAGRHDVIEGYWRKRDKFPNREFTMKYFLEYDGDPDDLKFNDGEVQEVKWMDAQEILESMNKNPNQWSGSAQGMNETWEWLKMKLRN